MKREQLIRAIERMAPGDRKVLALRVIERGDDRSIAKQLGWRDWEVRNSYHRTMRAIGPALRTFLLGGQR